MYERLEPGMEKDGTFEVVLKVQVRSVVELGPVSSVSMSACKKSKEDDGKEQLTIECK